MKNAEAIKNAMKPRETQTPPTNIEETFNAPKLVRTSIQLEEKIAKYLKLAATLNGKTQREILEEALSDYFQTHPLEFP